MQIIKDFFMVKKRTGNHMIKSPKLFNFILMSIWFLYVNSCEVDHSTLFE